MAYAALLSLTRTLDNILFFRDELLNLDEELHIKSLHQKLSVFISFLEEISQKNSESIEDLEERIRDAVYEAEYVIEPFMSKKILSKTEASTEDSQSIADLKERLKKIMEKLDSMWEAVEKMNNIEALQIDNHLSGPAAPVKAESTTEIEMDEIEEVEKMPPKDSSSSKSAPKNTSAPVVGLEDDMLQIKELLAGSPIELEAISIVGMGGIGKTTLARSIYNCSFVNGRFDVRAWTTVSQTYDVVTLLADLLKSMGKLDDEIMKKKDPEEQKDLLKLKMYKSLRKIRYLIIMDDVWDTDFLQEFKNIFPDDKNGSRIIMTSRLSKVDGSNYCCSHIHRMNFLSLEQSWNLLRQKALGEEPCPPELEEIGWKIAEKCKGLPLALAVIGGALYKEKKVPEHWKYFEENIKSSEAGNYDDLMEKLSWSYNHLPHHLKACLLYMAVFPEDYVIRVSHLLRLWLGEGFIKPVRPKRLEQVATEYLEDLISRNMIMVNRRNYCGEIKTCTMHDLMRDFCIRKAGEKMLLHIIDNDDPKVIGNKRCLSSHRSWFFFDHLLGRDVHPLRSLLCFGRKYVPGYILNLFPLQLLRVFDACNESFKVFPIEITKLVNLRYLAFFYEGNDKIPTSISNLCNLQTLIIARTVHTPSVCNILYLPAEMLKNMPLLRHLVVYWSSFVSDPCGARNGNLQLLSGLTDLIFTEDVVDNILADLKKLRIFYNYGPTTEWSFYCMENIALLHQLENLKIHFNFMIFHPLLPLSVCFPQKLNKLTLRSCMISSEHTSIIGSLPNLQVLKLKHIHFRDNAWKTNEGEFSELKFLHIESPRWKDWEAEETHFPSLECLSLANCQRLKCIPPGIGEIPTLQDLFLYECSSGIVDSANQILSEQHKFGNESFQLHEGSHSGISFRKR